MLATLVRRLTEAHLPIDRFIRLRHGTKIPINVGWPKNLLLPSQINLRRENYGVVGGRGLLLIDTDREPLMSVLKQSTIVTFRVKSPGHGGGLHFYFKIGTEIKNAVLSLGTDKTDKPINVGHIQYTNKFLVGPDSLHPNGGLYRIVRNYPIAPISTSYLAKLLAPFMKKRKREKLYDERQFGNVWFDIRRLLNVHDYTRQGSEYYGSHPVHGSDTGMNFWFNPSRNVEFCFRHSTGGGPIQLLAVLEGIVDCEFADKLTVDEYKKTVEIAIRKGYIR